jgi:hypothetical protein
MPNTELVENVWVPERQVRDHEVRKENPSKHWHVNDAPGFFHVATFGFQADLLDGRFDRLNKYRVEVNHDAASQISFLTERHVDETVGLMIHAIGRSMLDLLAVARSKT